MSNDQRLADLAAALEAANTGNVRSYRTEAAAILAAIDAAVSKPEPSSAPTPEPEPDDEPEPKAKRKPGRRY